MMYFPTCNHYFDKVEPLDECSIIDTVQDIEDNENTENTENTKYSEDHECLICLEINDKNDFICIKIQNMFYSKDCLCNGWIHHYCLDIWYIQNKRCPICLCKMSKNETNDKLVNNHDIVIRNHDIVITNISSTLCLFIRYSIYIFIFFNMIFLLDQIIQITILFIDNK